MKGVDVLGAVDTHHWSDWTVSELVAHKGRTGQTVSVVVPARNEAATVGAVVSRLRGSLVDGAPFVTDRLVDEVVVIDSDSDDDTFAVATEAGAVAHRSRDIRPDLGSFPGKGEAMWKSMFVTTGDILVFLDADLIDWDPYFVPALLGPMLTMPDVSLVKAAYQRAPADVDQGAFESGRVTELVARPLIAMLVPELSGLLHPLAGEWGIRRSLFETLTVPTGYAVELAALVDTVRSLGPQSISQVDVGPRTHRHQSLNELGAMSTQIISAVLKRQGWGSDGLDVHLRQFASMSGAITPLDRRVDVAERPPARSMQR